MKDLQQLYPTPGPATLRGLYLREPLLPRDWDNGIFVYSNFVISIDGRITTEDLSTNASGVPKAIANPRDWRLFQELAAQSDVLLTNGSHLRRLKNPRVKSVLPLSAKPEFQDLHDWRMARGLASQPDVAVLSARLDFELPAVLLQQQRRIYVFTPSTDRAAVAGLRRAGATVIEYAPETIAGGMVGWLEQAGYRRLYSVAGPRVLNSLLEDDVVDALFLTTVHRIIGGDSARTLHHGALQAPADFVLRSLYLDVTNDPQQTLARYDRRR